MTLLALERSPRLPRLRKVELTPMRSSRLSWVVCVLISLGCKSKPNAYDGNYDFDVTDIVGKNRSSYRGHGKTTMLVSRASGDDLDVTLLGCTFPAKATSTPGIFDIVPTECFLAVPSGQNHKQKYSGQLQALPDALEASLALTVTNGWGTTTFAFQGQRPK